MTMNVGTDNNNPQNIAFLEKWSYSIAFIIVLVLLFAPLARVAGERLGYIGCYPVGSHPQTIFTGQPYNISTLDECLLHCRNDLKAIASISGNTCFCSNEIPEGEKIPEPVSYHCNITCSGHAKVYCGGKANYSVFNTTVGICPPLKVPANGGVSRTLFRVGQKVFFTCFPGYDLIGSKDIECLEQEEDEKAVWSGHSPTCARVSSQWLRYLIDVVLILLGSSLFILLFFAVRSRRCCPKKVRSRTLTTREDFSMPDCAMVSTLGSKYSPRILSQSYRSFSQCTLENSTEVQEEDDQNKLDIDDHGRTRATKVRAMTESRLETTDHKENLGETKNRKKASRNVFSESSKTNRKTMKVSSVADIIHDSKTETPTSSSITTQSPVVPPKPTKFQKSSGQGDENVFLNNRCKSAYIPGLHEAKTNSAFKTNPKKGDFSRNQGDEEPSIRVQNQPARKSDIYFNTAEIASRWHVKQSLKVDQEEQEVIDGKDPEPQKPKPAVMPRRKRPKAINHECFSMLELDRVI